MNSPYRTDDQLPLEQRRVPILLACLTPFRLVAASGSAPWNPTIEQINGRSWDYVELHRLVGGLDVGLESPYHMVVCRDGVVGLPALPHLRDAQAAVEFFNRCFASLLVGGVYCEAITADSLGTGSIIDWTFLRSTSLGVGCSGNFHQGIRMRMSSPLEAIHLMSPRSIALADLTSALREGSRILATVPSVSSEFLLKGVSGYSRRDWGAAVANLWIVAEQLTSQLWEAMVLAQARNGPEIAGRQAQLTDPRTWTVSAKHELLCQIGVIEAKSLRSLSGARKARNRLAHTGEHPGLDDAKLALDSVLLLLRAAASCPDIPMSRIDLEDHLVSDPFTEPARPVVEPQYWLPIPKLPGEEELERLEAKSERARRGE